MDLNNVQYVCNQIEKFEFEELFTVLAKNWGSSKRPYRWGGLGKYFH